MGTFLQNWMMLRAQSAPRGGEIPDPLVDDYVQNGLIIHLDGKMKGGDPTKWIDRKGLVSFNYGSAITPAADGVITAEGGAVASNEVFANHYIDTTNYSFEMVWELISSPGTYMIFATPRSDYDNGPYIGVLASSVLFGDPSTGSRMRMSMSVPTDYHTLQITSGISSSALLVDGVSQSIAGADYFGGTDLHFWLGSPGGRKLPNAKLKCIRVYNRPLAISEMLHNLAVDNERFNLGLRVYIPFADPAVEAICVANWSSDGVGLTLDDAEAVTSQQFRGKFAGNTQIVAFDEFQYFTGVDRLFDGDGFYGCSNLVSLKLPDTMQTLGWQCLTCPSLAGTLLIPASVTSISRAALEGTVGLTNLINRMATTTDFFAGNTSHASGNGTGILYTKNWNAASRYQIANYKHVVIDGDIAFTAIDWLFQDGTIQSIRVNGNFSGHSLLWSYSGTVEFAELMGQIDAGSTRLLSQDVYKSNAILHLGYNGIAGTPAQLHQNKVTTIYVGSGESQAGDQAILNQYLADPDWAQYSSKLDLWYNYNGEYKNWPTIPTT